MKAYYLFYLIFSMIMLTACSSEQDSNFKINTVFGYKFGDIPDFAPDIYLADKQTLEALHPEKMEPFTSYQVIVTPGKHKIFGITASTKPMYTLDNCKEGIRAVSAQLIKQYAPDADSTIKVSENDDGWSMTEKSARTLTLACSETYSPDAVAGSNFQLALLVTDKRLSGEAFKEWKQRQNSEEKFKN